MGALRSLWHSLKSWLFNRPSTRPTNLGNPDLNPIDTEQLAKELNLDQQAESLGKRNLPGRNDENLTGLESKIIQVVQKARQDYVDWAHERLKHLNREINAVDLSLIASQLRQPGR